MNGIVDDNIENDHRIKLSKKGPIRKQGNFFLCSPDYDMNPPWFRIEVYQRNGYDTDKTQFLAQDRKNGSNQTISSRSK